MSSWHCSKFYHPHLSTTHDLAVKRPFRAFLRLLSRMFFFSVFNVLLVTCLSGGIFAALTEASSQPGRVPLLLGEKLPGTYLFYASYLLLAACTTLPLRLLNLGPWQAFCPGASCSSSRSLLETVCVVQTGAAMRP